MAASFLTSLHAQVLDINPGPIGCSARAAIDFNGSLMLIAHDGTAWGLWKTDGTFLGSARLTNLPTLVSPPRILHASSHHAFAVFDGALWASAGTAATTTLLRSFRPSQPVNEIGSIGDVVLFGATEDTQPFVGHELWQSNGTPQGTAVLADIHPGQRDSDPRGLDLIGSRLMFCADSAAGTNGHWMTDGTSSGTTELVPGNCSIRRSVAFRGKALLAGNSSLSISDGTRWNTLLIYNGSMHELVVTDDGRAFFTTQTGLWTTDGTFPGTTQVAGGMTPTRGLAAVGRNVVFAATTSASGPELWISDGTASGTRMIRDINPGATGSDPRELVATGSRFVYFDADDGTSGRELWKTDGTRAGTTRVVDLNPGPPSSNPFLLRLAGGMLFFIADDGFSGAEPWVGPVGASTKAIGGSYSDGLRSPTLSANDPVIGSTVTFRGLDAQPNTTMLLTLSAPPTAPTRLGRNCIAYIDPARLTILTTKTITASTWQHGIAVPNVPALAGVKLIAQAAFVPTTSPLGFDLSRGLYLGLGN